MTTPRAFPPTPPALRCRRSLRTDHAFTLVELLVVIGIIAVLISILVPVAAKIRISAQDAASQGMIAQLLGACESYKLQFGAYPGPIPNYGIYSTRISLPGPITLTGNDIIYFYDRSNVGSPRGAALADQGQITMAENMVLGLMGGLFRDTDGRIYYDPTLVGTGPRTLGPSLATAKSFPAFLASTNLYHPDRNLPRFHDDAGTADDSQIPEFVDSFSNPLPILYLRAVVGRTIPSTVFQNQWSANMNPVISYLVDPRVNDPVNTSTVGGPYDVSQILAYTGSYPGTTGGGESNSPTPPSGTQSIGVGKRLSRYYVQYHPGDAFYSSTSLPSGALPYHGLRTVDPTSVSAQSAATSSNPYSLPMDAFAYFKNPQSSNIVAPRNQDGFILIGAGKDRVYGSEDDNTNFGAVNP